MSQISTSFVIHLKGIIMKANKTARRKAARKAKLRKSRLRTGKVLKKKKNGHLTST